MEVLLLLTRVWRLTLLLHILLPTFGHSAAVPLWRAKKLFLEHESTVDSESITPDQGRNRRSDEDSSSNSDSGGLACDDPGVPANGRRVGDEFYVGRELFFACEPGFVLRGSEVLTCRYGDVDDVDPHWDGELPRCIGKKSACKLHAWFNLRSLFVIANC